MADQQDWFAANAPKGQSDWFAAHAPKEAPKPAEKGWLESAEDFVKNHPAELGAIAGGIAAVPLTGGTSLLPAAAAAGLGGAGGAGLGMIAGAIGGSPNLPNSPLGVLKTMGEQGAIQGAAEAGGRALMGALKTGASRLYQSALKPTLAARTEFPDLVETGLSNAVPVSKGGAELAAALVGESKNAADQLVRDAAAQPNAPRIDPRDAVGGITQAIKDVRQLPVARPQMQAIGNYGREYLAEHPAPITLEQAQNAIRATDRYFDPAYRATMDRGNPITSGQTAAALGINNETRALLRDAVPGLQGQNANTAALAGLRDAIERRAGQLGNNSPIGMQHLINAGLGAGVGGVRGRDAGLGTFAGAELLTNPALASRAAIIGAKTASIPMPQVLRAALLARLGADTEP